MAALSGCSWIDGVDPCPGVREGVEFGLEILRPVEPDTTCHEAWGFPAGTVIEGRIVAVQGDQDCKAGVPQIASAGGFTWMKAPDLYVNGGRTLEGRYVLSGPECAATLWLIVRSDPPLACDADHGDLCNLELRLAPANGSEASCPARCSERFDIRAEVR